MPTHSPPTPADEYLSTFVRHISNISLLDTHAYPPPGGQNSYQLHLKHKQNNHHQQATIFQQTLHILKNFSLLSSFRHKFLLFMPKLLFTHTIFNILALYKVTSKYYERRSHSMLLSSSFCFLSFSKFFLFETTNIMKKQFLLLMAIIAFAFTANATHWYVNKNATGANNGTSWANAYTDLQNAISASSANDSIFVTSNVYYPTTTTDRNISFVIKDGLKLYGGVNGTETSLSQRDFKTNVTVLSGDIGTVDVNTDNSCNIIAVAGLNSLGCLIDGFAIRDGQATANYSYLYNRVTINQYQGAGIVSVNNLALIKINNCIITNNFTGINPIPQGGGHYNDNSLTEVTNSIYSNNAGGGINHRNNLSINLINVVFSKNYTFNLEAPLGLLPAMPLDNFRFITVRQNTLYFL
jgi:hypothetical protein